MRLIDSVLSYRQFTLGVCENVLLHEAFEREMNEIATQDTLPWKSELSLHIPKASVQQQESEPEQHCVVGQPL